MTSKVKIERIAAGGDGVGRLENGLVVFVPRSAPGDIVEIEVTDLKKRYGRGRISRVLTPSQERVEPECPHYNCDDCGGCQLQHLSADAQRDSKRKFVGDALRRIAGLDVEDPVLEPSHEQWRYRSKITLAVQGGRIGFHQVDRPVAVFELEDCLLANQGVISLWHCVRQFRSMLPTAMESLIIRMDRGGRSHVLVVGGETAWNPTQLASGIGVEDASFWWKPPKGAARVVAGSETGYPAVAFEQMNFALAQRIRERAVDSLGEVDGKVAWDLFGGVGDIAEMIAARGAAVWSVDSNRAAVEWGRRENANAEGMRAGVTRIASRAEEVVGRLPEPDIVVVNPPRVGLGRPLTGWLERWGIRRGGARMAYISCDPATLARDLTRMKAFGLRECVSFDLFPQTAHVETLTILEAA